MPSEICFLYSMNVWLHFCAPSECKAKSSTKKSQGETVVWMAYFHVVSVMALYAALVASHVSMRPSLGAEDAKRLAVLDGIFWITALLASITGVALLMGAAGKPFEYYLQTPMFHAKATFFVVGLLAWIWPSIQIFRAAKQTKLGGTVSLSKGVKHIQRLLLVLFLVLPFMGLAMSKGF
jgi:putative membrane protein